MMAISLGAGRVIKGFVVNQIGSIQVREKEGGYVFFLTAEWKHSRLINTMTEILGNFEGMA